MRACCSTSRSMISALRSQCDTVTGCDWMEGWILYTPSSQLRADQGILAAEGLLSTPEYMAQRDLKRQFSRVLHWEPPSPLL